MNIKNATEYSYEESNARMARGVCISVKRVGNGPDDLVFCCNGTIPAEHLAEGYGCCKRCANEELENYRHCESMDARRTEEMYY